MLRCARAGDTATLKALIKEHGDILLKFASLGVSGGRGLADVALDSNQPKLAAYLTKATAAAAKQVHADPTPCAPYAHMFLVPGSCSC